MTKKQNRKISLTKKSVITSLAIFLLILNVFFTLQMASLGVQVASLENSLEKLAKTNSDLQESLVKSSSLTLLDSTSDQLGFVKVDDSLYIKGEGVYTGLLR